MPYSTSTHLQIVDLDEGRKFSNTLITYLWSRRFFSIFFWLMFAYFFGLHGVGPLIFVPLLYIAAPDFTVHVQPGYILFVWATVLIVLSISFGIRWLFRLLPKSVHITIYIALGAWVVLAT